MALIRLHTLLGDTSPDGLEALARQARDMSDLAARLRAVLPVEVRPNLVAVNLRPDGELVLVGSSSSWAARLRFEAETVLEAARAAGAEATRVAVRVARQPRL